MRWLRALVGDFRPFCSPDGFFSSWEKRSSSQHTLSFPCSLFGERRGGVVSLPFRCSMLVCSVLLFLLRVPNWGRNSSVSCTYSGSVFSAMSINSLMELIVIRISRIRVS
ncbi:hypothetical protein F2Q70_00032530 [Brassica cretica]|uniref:Uncharacterized protein n=1 Tax=Brassica cretica TaxID=69181 RepID=A0A8S9FFK2_BRACR|nr:hypothetical protein F2Q70_00032530 [Brassica cretica]